MKKTKVRLKTVKGSGYRCPVCKEGDLIEVRTEKDFGCVNIKFNTMDDVGFEFKCKAKNNNFFLCYNESCRARFERTKLRRRERKVGPPCPTGNCDGSLKTYSKVPVAKIYPKEGSEDVILTYGKHKPIKFKIVSGQFSYDDAGICTQCNFVCPKEIDLK
ncbi:MAG: hypothetical protein JSW28_04775 [Thermoplasmata archaeon]|nr:MAG: hypothetical protein JSW28_04775 [Thermoplasmata archaeon]